MTPTIAMPTLARGGGPATHLALRPDEEIRVEIRVWCRWGSP
ncbi:MAG: hypothetical protein RQ745_13375 [Longimicrobiales bacterium]|nr:hypothetical protein [Longimicrobiales bacterium]